MPGDEPLKVSAWAVEDVARWLQTLSLGQYREAFVDAAVDGAFLYDLNDEDLKNTLGIEHRLHRKKILSMVHKLKVAEAERNRQLQLTAKQEQAEAYGLPLPSHGPADEYLVAGAAAAAPGVGVAGSVGVNVAGAELAPGTAGVQDIGGAAGAADRPPLVLDELMAWVRHSKYKKLKEAFDGLPNKRFDKQLVQTPYVDDFGTAYVDAYEREAFNVNKMDEFGNTMLLAAAQNGGIKVCKLLIEKGANPDHQNKQGQTAAHFANAYGSWDLLSWLFEEGGGGADDSVENKFGLGVYDGLTPAIEDGEEEEDEN